jgi:hypothetical protein
MIECHSALSLFDKNRQKFEIPSKKYYTFGGKLLILKQVLNGRTSHS